MANGAIGTRTGADATTTETNSEAETQKLRNSNGKRQQKHTTIQSIQIG